MKKNLLLLMLLCLTMLCVGQKVPFQGKLIESGTAVEGTRTVVFEISAVSWTETHTDVSVTDGLYFVVLGSINPLPVNLFNGVSEQSLGVTVEGTALSPVILYKPFVPEYEGKELHVRNTAGTVVGSLHALVDSADQIGELVVSGTNGNPNVTLSGYGDGGNLGSIQVHNSQGDAKADLSANDNAGRFVLSGENTGRLIMDFAKMSAEEGKGFPHLTMAIDGLYYARMYTVNSNAITNGHFYLASDNGDWNYMRSDGFFLHKDGKLLSQYRIHDWGDVGYSGFFDLRGPNSTNIEMSSKHWVNADLPWFKLVGSQNQDAIQMSVEEDETESAFINLSSLDGKESFINTTSLVFKDTMNGHSHIVELGTNNNTGNGSTGYLNLSGPNWGNIWMGSRDLEGPDLPLINLSGENGFHAMEISVGRDDDNNQFGYINLMSENGNSFQLNPDGFGTEKVNIFTEVHDNNKTGHIHVNGPNTLNISMGGKHYEGNPELPYMHFKGDNEYQGAEISIDHDGENNQFGQLNLNSENGSSVNMNSEELLIFGSNSVNIQMGGQTWDNNDLGFFQLFTDKPDGNGWYQAGARISAGTDGTNSWGSMELLNNGEGKIDLNGNTGDINIAGTLNQNSDRRLKKDIMKLSNALSNITKLQGVSYYWKSDKLNAKPQIGLIAQEVEKVYPEFVATKDDGYKALNYSQIVAVLIEATKELNAKVEKLESENTRLRAELSSSSENSTQIAQMQQQVEALVKLVGLQQLEEKSSQIVSVPGLK